ncbi:MAG: metal ABC transporter substrate-binding protein [Propionibacteriaceae bacterium]|nr:metal ABC transporter substrate-binding protein [Propionibacteriaceae bacterium]
MKIKPCLAAIVPLFLAVAGCSAGAASDPSPGTSTPGTLRVVAGLYPLEYLADAVGGDRVTVENLTVPGTEPHDLELTARQVAAVAEADLVVFERTLQPAVDDAVDTAPARRALDVTTIVPLVDRDTSVAAEETPGAEESEADDHDHGDTDPHLWLDPTNMIDLAHGLADELASIDPDGATVYTANAETLAQRLNDLDAAFSTGLATCQRRTFITSHAAFGYLADRYDLAQISISGLAPDAMPSPARIAEITTLAHDEGLTTVFFETLTSPEVAETIARDAGLATDVLDPVEGITDQSHGSDYAEIMESNLTALRSANGCS